MQTQSPCIFIVQTQEPEFASSRIAKILYICTISDLHVYSWCTQWENVANLLINNNSKIWLNFCLFLTKPLIAYWWGGVFLAITKLSFCHKLILCTCMCLLWETTAVSSSRKKPKMGASLWTGKTKMGYRNSWMKEMPNDWSMEKTFRLKHFILYQTRVETFP